MDSPLAIPTLPGAAFRLPPRLEGLRAIAYNLWWSWHPEARALFSRIDSPLWARHRNPIRVLAAPRAWTDLLEDVDFMADYEALDADFERYMADGRGHWFAEHHGTLLTAPIAYFCAEYGFHESLGIYSGGLGILAGDHAKAASDMALPFVGIGLLYRKGYFRQTIDADGHQEHAYPDYDVNQLPLRRVQAPDGEPLHVYLELPDRILTVAVWLAQVGRVPILLLDTDVAENDEADRPITNILYVRGRETRFHQELVLGVGGVRALRALGIAPSAWHLNEGHSALLLAERARELVAAGHPVDEAFQRIKGNSVFTIHTPVSAGNERFDAELVRRVAGPLFEGDGRPNTGGIPISQLLELGRGIDAEPDQLDLTALSIRLTNGTNAVSRLHAVTANHTWRPILEKPILGITNGVHTPTWLGRPLRDLFGRVLEADVDDLDAVDDPNRFWGRVGTVPERELWRAHQHQKLELSLFARHRLRTQLARHGEAPRTLRELDAELDPEILTIGFARRFATYKRANLLFADIDRLARILWNEERPVQIIFAGKAHPADRPGQGVIQEIFSRSRSSELRGRVFILEDYDMRIARFLVQGVDVWLNNPRRPLEASGTSGMKAAANGVVNMSVLDGWWDEGWNGTNGWAIGGRESDPDEGAQDWRDAQDLYRILEEEVVPRYYARDETGFPHEWVQQMSRSISSMIWRFSTTRMLHEYAEQLYLPAAGVRPWPKAEPAAS